MSKRWRYAIGLTAFALIALVYYFSQSAVPSEIKPEITPAVVPATPQAVPVQPQVEAPLRGSRPMPDEATITQLRSRAKLNLSALYTAQASFFADYNRYSTDLVFIGWSPSHEQMDFKIGFLYEYRPAKLVVISGTEEDPSRLDSDEFLGGDDRYQYTKAAESINLFDYEKLCRRGCTATNTTFEILVIFPIGDSGKVDVWSINQDKKLLQLWDGVTGQALKQTRP